MKGTGGMSRIGGIAKGVTDAIDEYPPDQGGSSLPGLPTFSSPDFPSKQEGEEKGEEVFEEETRPFLLRGILPGKSIGTP